MYLGSRSDMLDFLSELISIYLIYKFYINFFYKYVVRYKHLQTLVVLLTSILITKMGKKST